MACTGRSVGCDVFTAKQFDHILKQSLGEGAGGCEVVACDKRPAAEGLAGFLGDHARVTLHVRVNGTEYKKIKLFVKSLPLHNAPKADFIKKYGYFKREMVALQLAERMRGAEGPNPWCARVYLCSESVVVMPDLTRDGYRTLHIHETLDLKHTLLTAASLARFHASFANYAAERSARDRRPYDFLSEYGDVVAEPTFCDSPWLRAAAKLTFNFLKMFSDKFERFPRELESLLVRRYLAACATLADDAATLNVMLHRDLWINNVMFKYAGDQPTSALLIDFQCLRYGPPAFDLMSFLYLTTDRSFRERHEADVRRHYFDVFSATLEVATRDRLRSLNYSFESFECWCERSRMFGMFMAIGIFPYVLMEPVLAQKTFDDPATFMQYCDVDRSGPVLAYARRNRVYRERQLELSEEFVERYVLGQPTAALPHHRQQANTCAELSPTEDIHHR